MSVHPWGLHIHCCLRICSNLFRDLCVMCARGYRFVFVLVDYAMRYPKAVPLHNISANYTTLCELYELLGVCSIRTSVYHPQTDSLVERFSKTLKNMIRKVMHEDSGNWDKWLDPLLFAVREVPQASTGFSPFELLFSRKLCGVLNLVMEIWEMGPITSKNEVQHVLDLRVKLNSLGQLSQENFQGSRPRNVNSVCTTEGQNLDCFH